MKFARPLPLVVLFRAVAVTGRNQSQLKIVCSLASCLARRFSEEILRKSSSWWRRHDLRASLFVCIRALKFSSKPRLTFTGSSRLSSRFSCVIFAVSRRANVMTLDNPLPAFFPHRQNSSSGGCSPLPLLAGGRKVRRPPHQPTPQHLPLDTQS